MFWLTLVCAALTVVIGALVVKIALLHKAMDEIRAELSQRLHTDTNTLLSISSGDGHIRKLAADLNVQLRLLRKERRRFQSGDRELKEAVTNISHDLRTPLTAICGYLDLLEKEEKTPEMERYLSLVKNRTQALTRLTEELFRYSVIASAPETLALEAVDLNAALEESVAAHYTALTQRGIAPVVRMPESRVIRPLNHAALSRVFGNILHNALKYSAGDLEISLCEAGEILFANTAPELDEVQVGKLFHRFYTVEAARNSTGLGLTIAQTLVERMNGQITAQYSNRRLGVRIVFPREGAVQSQGQDDGA